MAISQSSKVTKILIDSIDYKAIISTTRSEITSAVSQEQLYNYRGGPVTIGGSYSEFSHITMLFAKYEYDRLRSNLTGGIEYDEIYPNDMSSIYFTIVVTIKPPEYDEMGLLNLPSSYAAKEITYENCRIVGKSDIEINRDSIFYTTSVTIAVSNVIEKRIRHIR